MKNTRFQNLTNSIGHENVNKPFNPSTIQPFNHKKAAFTLAEVLITLGVIGVVAAVTLPVLMTNIQARIQKEQVRSAKYKFTLATDKMKSLGLLGEQYPTTEAFVNELSKHLKLAKVCDKDHLRECWTSDEITLSDGTTKNITTIKTGTDLLALAPGTKDTTTMGIVTGDGVPMILVYSPKCTPLETERTYSWSTVDNKPETNATTNCLSAIMDINGNKKPNKIGKDIRTWNSLYASRDFGDSYDPLARNGSDHYECKQLKDKLGIQNCRTNNKDDYWGGAVKKCNEIGLHLPSTQTLALAAGTRYGRSDMTPYTIIMSVQFAKSNYKSKDWFSADMTCEQMIRKVSISWAKYAQIICIDNGDSTNTNKSIGDDDEGAPIKLEGSYWSASETSANYTFFRNIFDKYTNYSANSGDRASKFIVLCVGD